MPHSHPPLYVALALAVPTRFLGILHTTEVAEKILHWHYQSAQNRAIWSDNP